MDEEKFIITLSGIIYNKKIKRILIGRREKDNLVPELKWSFPGGRFENSVSLEESLLDEIKKKTGLNKINLKNIIFARITPEMKGKQFILYYYCETNEDERNAKAGEKFVEIKWINPIHFK